ncbi:MAG: MipA/OmpV family protein [Deltaproteobacteria bacterium]|nr:MipA/OmpV family protein [Deltaproteobacteria bacterium]MBW2070456.1 MipA/OmpV family protein [Deltaproteobacteria bacterium]
MKTSKTLSLLILSLFATAALAFTPPAALAADVSIGAGAGVVPDYEGSDDYEVVPVPYLTVKWDNNMSLDLLGNKAKANLLPSPTWKLGPIFQYIKQRDNVDDNKVDKMKNVGTSLMAGGFLGFHYENWRAGIEAMTDVNNGNDGSIVRLNGGYSIPFAPVWNLSIGVYTTWADDDYMSSYFGVDRKDAERSGLKRYNADSGFKDVGTTFTLSYSPWQRVSLLGIAGYKRLLGDAADSPVTDDRGDENQFVAAIVAVYHFNIGSTEQSEVGSGAWY